jgi:hypothetical protein
MDSNFQVKISVDLSQLNSKLKEVDSALKSLGFTADESNKKMTKSFEQTSVAAQKVSADMSRVRLATFAFGQVIRDAGFFSQNFGLGMLAISNNIPILIDQLVLLSGVSAGLGSVLSVLGSVLAAGLTVFAYWAQGVERDGGTVSGAINKMANDSQSSIGRLVQYLSTPPASEMLGKAVYGIQQAMDAINAIIDAGINLAIAIWEKFGPTVLAALDKFFALAKNVMLISLNILRFAAAVVKGDWETALGAIGNIGKSVFNNLIELAQAYIGFITKGLGAVISLYDPLKGAMIQAAGQQVAKLGDSVKFTTEGFGDFNFDLLSVINNLFKVGKQATDTKKSLDDLGRSRRESLPKEAYVKEPFQKPIFAPIKGKEVKTFELFPSKLFDFEKQQLKDFVLESERTSQQIYDIFQNGIVDTISNSMIAIGEAFATGGNVGNAFGAALLGGIASMAEQLGRMAIGIGLAIENIKKSLSTLSGPFAIAAGIALLALAGAARSGAKSIAGGGGAGIGNTQAAPPPSNFGSLRGQMTFPTNTSSMAVTSALQTQGTLETRVSGNDLVILYDRAKGNRNTYF